MVRFQSLKSQYMDHNVGVVLVPRSLNCEYFSIFPPGGLLENSRYDNVRSNVGIIYNEGHVNMQKKSKRGVSKY